MRFLGGILGQTVSLSQAFTQSHKAGVTKIMPVTVNEGFLVSLPMAPKMRPIMVIIKRTMVKVFLLSGFTGGRAGA